MAEEKISELDDAAALDGTEFVPVVQGGSTLKVLLSAIKTFFMSFVNGSFAPISGGVIPLQYLPNAVFDVILGTYINTTTFNVSGSPVTLQEGKIYKDNSGGANNNKRWRYDGSLHVLVEVDGASLMTAAQIKTAYESNANTNAYTTTEKTQLATNTTNIALKQNIALTVNSITGNYTLVLSDAGKQIQVNSASAITLTIPTNSSVAIPINTPIEIHQIGAGKVIIVGAGGVTINNVGGNTTTTGNGAIAALIKVSTNTWTLIGMLE